jgi:hypothetical protein
MFFQLVIPQHEKEVKMNKIKNKTKKVLIIIVFIVLFINIFSLCTYSKKSNINLQNTDNFPTKFSWQDINGTDYTTPVRNQELSKSDASFALVASLETILQYKMGYPFYCDFSEASLFYNCNGSFENGVNITRCADYLVEYGVPDEGCFPYPERDFNPELYFNQSDWENRSIKIQDWIWVENNIPSIKKALIQNGPVIIQINYPFNFINYKEGIYKPKGKIIGDQWICIVGYDDDAGIWICKNSWGVKWGENGYVRIPYGADVINSKVSFSDKSTGILSINGTIGEINQKIPIVKIFQPKRGLKYTKMNKIISREERFPFKTPLLTDRSQYLIFNQFLSNIFKRKIIDIRTPLVKKACLIEICAVRYSGNVSIYIDDELIYLFNETTFIKKVIFNKPGFYTLKVEATNEDGIKSVDIREFLVTK